jgi:TrmH family RNA methyltransferase
MLYSEAKAMRAGTLRVSMENFFPAVEGHMSLMRPLMMARRRLWYNQTKAFSSSSEAIPDLPVQNVITSTANSYVKHLVKLRTSPQYRSEAQRVLLVSSELIAEASASTVSSSIAVFVSEDAQQNLSIVPGLKVDRTFKVSEAVMKKICGLESVASIGAVAEIPMPRQADFSTAKTLTKLLILDRVQDPGNMGTIFRSALAFGWEGVFLLEGCCDPYGDKALRSSRGASLRLPVGRGSMADLLQLTSSMVLFSAEPEEGARGVQSEVPSDLNRICLVLGSEGEGVSPELKKHCISLSIPMADDMESLNVAVAGGILMFLLSNLSLSPFLRQQIERLGSLND